MLSGKADLRTEYIPDTLAVQMFCAMVGAIHEIHAAVHTHGCFFPFLAEISGLVEPQHTISDKGDIYGKAAEKIPIGQQPD